MIKREVDDRPNRSLTPEHDMRGAASRGTPHPEISAAYDYVESVLDTSDFKDPVAWHGWALREAFLAGVTHSRKAGSRQDSDHQTALDKVHEMLFCAGGPLNNSDLRYTREQMAEFWRIKETLGI